MLKKIIILAIPLIISALLSSSFSPKSSFAAEGKEVSSENEEESSQSVPSTTEVSDEVPDENGDAQSEVDEKAETHSLSAEDGEEKKYKCRKGCDKRFKRASGRTQHERIHSDERKYKCQRCDRSFKTNANLAGHLKTHDKTYKAKNKCIKCGGGFTRASTLKEHLKICGQPRSKRQKECNICGKVFKRPGHLEKHLNTHKEHQCNNCEKSYASLQSLKKHQRTHTGEMPYECPECHRKFNDSTSLSDHAKSEHPGLEPFKCEYCEQSFTEKKELNKHVKTHELKCPECGKTFEKRAHFTKHLKTHEGKSYQCSECDKSFSRGDTLSKHMATHTDEGEVTNSDGETKEEVAPKTKKTPKKRKTREERVSKRSVKVPRVAEPSPQVAQTRRRIPRISKNLAAPVIQAREVGGQLKKRKRIVIEDDVNTDVSTNDDLGDSTTDLVTETTSSQELEVGIDLDDNTRPRTSRLMPFSTYKRLKQLVEDDVSVSVNYDEKYADDGESQAEMQVSEVIPAPETTSVAEITSAPVAQAVAPPARPESPLADEIDLASIPDIYSREFLVWAREKPSQRPTEPSQTSEPSESTESSDLKTSSQNSSGISQPGPSQPLLETPPPRAISPAPIRAQAVSTSILELATAPISPRTSVEPSVQAPIPSAVSASPPRPTSQLQNMPISHLPDTVPPILPLPAIVRTSNFTVPQGPFMPPAPTPLYFQPDSATVQQALRFLSMASHSNPLATSLLRELMQRLITGQALGFTVPARALSLPSDPPESTLSQAPAQPTLNTQQSQVTLPPPQPLESDDEFSNLNLMDSSSEGEPATASSVPLVELEGSDPLSNYLDSLDYLVTPGSNASSSNSCSGSPR